jgi:hypothetical protein
MYDNAYKAGFQRTNTAVQVVFLGIEIGSREMAAHVHYGNFFVNHFHSSIGHFKLSKRNKHLV